MPNNNLKKTNIKAVFLITIFFNAFSVLYSNSAKAQSANINFVGSISDRCDIGNIQHGSLGVSSDKTQLSSRIAGGQNGLATLNCNRAAQIDLYAPQQLSNHSLTNPVAVSDLVIGGCTNQGGSEGNTVFAGNANSSYASPANSRNFGWTGGKVRVCSTLTVNMSLTNGASTMLPAGNYSFRVRISAVAP